MVSILSLLFSIDLSSYEIALAFPPTNQTTTNDTSTTIRTSNHPPLANAGINQTVNESETVVLNGVASDPDPNNKLTYLWKQKAGPLVKLSNSTGTNPSFVAPSVLSDSELQFSLTATDSSGDESNPAIVIVLVKHVNRIPVANTGADLIVNADEVVTLDASKSKDPDNDPLSYSWVQIDGPRVELDSGNTTRVTFIAPANISADTNLIFRLIVADDKKSNSTDEIKVTIKYIPPPNKHPVANAGTDQTVNASSIVHLNAGKSNDPDGNVTSYSWVQTYGPPVMLNDSDTIRPSFIIPFNISVDTPLKFSLTVKDDKKAESKNPAIVTVTVKRINHPPITMAGADQIVNSGYVVSLDGSKSKDPDGDPLTYSWTQIAGPNVTLVNNDRSLSTFMTPSNLAANTRLAFTLTVKDDKGDTDTDDIKLVVKYAPAPNMAPVADAGQDQMVNAGDTVTLDGTRSSDPDSDSLSYLWIQISGPPVQLNKADIASLSFKAPISIIADTTLIIRLIVTDDENGTDYDDVNIRVKYIHRSLPRFEQPPPINNSQNGTMIANQTTTSPFMPSVPVINRTLPINRTLATPTEPAVKSEQTDMNTIEGEDKQDNLSGTNETDNIEGHGKDDVIHGQAGNDRIEGDTGNDRLYGDGGNDLIEGGDKDDLLEGGEGDDTLSGGDGDDRMTGGTGKDHFNCGDGNLDRILDFNEGEGDTKELDCEVTTPDISEE